MICCICGESLDFAGKPIGDIIMTNYGIGKFICKGCKKIRDKKEEDIKNV